MHFDIFKRGAAHIGERRLPANDLRHHVRNQAVIGFQFGVLVREFIQPVDAARHGVAGRVIATDNQQDDIA